MAGIKRENMYKRKTSQIYLNQLQAYLWQIGNPIEFWEFSTDKLNIILGRFWISVRQAKLDEEQKILKFKVSCISSMAWKSFLNKKRISTQHHHEQASTWQDPFTRCVTWYNSMKFLKQL